MAGVEHVASMGETGTLQANTVRKTEWKEKDGK